MRPELWTPDGPAIWLSPVGRIDGLDPVRDWQRPLIAEAHCGAREKPTLAVLRLVYEILPARLGHPAFAAFTSAFSKLQP